MYTCFVDTQADSLFRFVVISTQRRFFLSCGIACYLLDLSDNLSVQGKAHRFVQASSYQSGINWLTCRLLPLFIALALSAPNTGNSSTPFFFVACGTTFGSSSPAWTSTLA